MGEAAANGVSGTVARSVRVLRFIGECRTTTIREASVALNLAPSTVHRLFDLLAREGMIEHDKTRHSYRAGPEFFRIAAQVVAKYDLRTIARPIMREVVATCAESCVLGLFLPAIRKMTLVEQVDPPLPLRYQLPLNTHLSLLSGASGRSILAFLAPDQIELILEEEKSESARMAWSRVKVSRELKVIQQKGFAVSHGEIVDGAMAIAAPVIGAEGRAIASLAVTAPNERMLHAGGVQRVSVLMRTMARELSVRLGGPKEEQTVASASTPTATRSGPGSRGSRRSSA